MDKLVYATYPLMLIILLYGAKWAKKGEWNEEFLSLEQTKYLQGYLAVCIMLHHIAQETCASWQKYKLIPGLEFFVPIGYFFVAFFVFCSGYGLYKSYQGKEHYFEGFFRKRVLPLIIAFYATGWLFFLARIIMKEKMNGWKIFCYVSGFGLPNLYAWFVVAMPFFYLCFFLSFRLIKNEKLKIVGVMAGVFAYTFLGTWVDHNDYWLQGEWWYNCVHLFWIGMVFAACEKKAVERMKRGYYIKLPLSLLITVVTFYISEAAQGIFSYYGEYNPSLSHWMVVGNRWICLFTQMVACGAFVAFVLYLNLKLKVGNRFLGFMGTITLEFYLIHGLVLEFFSYKFCGIVPSIKRITNVPLLIVVVFVPSVVLALGLKKITGLPNRKKDTLVS